MINNNSNDEDFILDETIELEIFAKEGKQPPKAKRYRIRVDDGKYDVEVSSMTGREILVLAGKTPPEEFKLRQKMHGQFKTIGLDERVDFTTPGIERFTTIGNDHTEGSY
jgi:hypothetical protein